MTPACRQAGSTGTWSGPSAPTRRTETRREFYQVIDPPDTLTELRERLRAQEVVYNAYRPCCDNPTAFPDCNHGAAALALAEMAAAEGASAEEIFAALKGFNSFWYPDRYYTLAVHFERRGQAWEDVDSRLVLSAEYSSLSGWKRVAAGVESQGLPGQLPGGASGCAA